MSVVSDITNSKDGEYEPLHTILCSPLNNAWNHISEMELDFIEIISDISNKQRDLTRTEARYALEVVLAISIVQRKREVLSQIPEEEQRNEQITKMTGLIAEPGLFPGSTPDEVLGSIAYRVNMLIEAYRRDKQNDDTICLWREAFKGPPCFNGRLISLEVYIAEKIELQSSTNIENLITVSDQTDYDETALKLLEIMYEYDDSKPPSKKAFREYVIAQHPAFLANFDKLFTRAKELFV